ncbi:UNVERIFIED_CONTAM: hypothetical protein Sradi_3624200 [Sesamum radiatum]|uniref:Uncharacterized protein n=1 Tax=Sesamum radiatum TaxID=300843 RepID=A0AAW2QHH0_SESRA
MTRIAQYDLESNHQAGDFDLATIEEKRDRAFARIVHYKTLMMKSYNTKDKTKGLPGSDLVLKKDEVFKHVGNLNPSWEGSYKVIEGKKKRTYKLQDLEGKDLPRPWNVHNLRKFYA